MRGRGSFNPKNAKLDGKGLPMPTKVSSTEEFLALMGIRTKGPAHRLVEHVKDPCEIDEAYCQEGKKLFSTTVNLFHEACGCPKKAAEAARRLVRVATNDMPVRRGVWSNIVGRPG